MGAFPGRFLSLSSLSRSLSLSRAAGVIIGNGLGTSLSQEKAKTSRPRWQSPRGRIGGGEEREGGGDLGNSDQIPLSQNCRFHILILFSVLLGLWLRLIKTSAYISSLGRNCFFFILWIDQIDPIISPRKPPPHMPGSSETR